MNKKHTDKENVRAIALAGEIDVPLKKEISKMMSTIARYKWSKTSKKDRKAHAEKMNKARWGK